MLRCDLGYSSKKLMSPCANWWWKPTWSYEHIFTGYRLVTDIQGVSKKYPPLKHFGIFSLQLSFCEKLCTFVRSSYSHISANFCTFILIFHQMTLFFHKYPSFSPCQVLSTPIHPENENAAFLKWCHFSSSHVSASDNCNQSITCLIVHILLTLF